MPTLQQLPQATSIDLADQFLVEKNGVAFVSDVATLLAQTQPRLTFAPNTLAGRNNLSTAGPPQPIQVGPGLTTQAGDLRVDSSVIAPIESPVFTGTPTAPTRAVLDSSSALATTAFVQANIARGQPVSLTGDVTGTGVGTISTTLAAIAVPGTYSKVQVNAKGQVVSGGQLQTGDVQALLPTATTVTAGVVRVGTGLTVQAGNLGVDPSVVAPIVSPAFTGTPTAPTPATLDSSTALATTAFVQANVARGQPLSLTGDLSGSGMGTISVTLPTISAPGTYSKVQVNAKGQVVSGGQLQAGDVQALLPTATTVTAGVVKVGTGLTVQAGNLGVDPSVVAPIVSPAFTGTPTAPTPATLDSSTALATTAFVQANVARGQPLSLTGDLSGSGVGTISVTLPAISAPGTYSKVQVNTKGQVVGGGQLQAADVLPLLPVATTVALGLVKVGTGLTIQTDGTINVNSGLKTVQDFGAVGDGVTDDTAAFLAYGTWLRQQRSVNGAQQAWVLGFGRRYIVSDTLDFTKYQYITFDGQNSQIISNVKGFAVIDALGMDNCTIRDLTLYAGSPNNPALIGLQLGVYVDNQGHPQNSIENLTITGYFKQSCVFNAGSETSVFTSLNLINRYVGPQWCYALVQDATGFWPIVSKYVAVARTPNAAFSFNENSFIEPIMQMTGGGPAVWMSATHRHSYRGGYVAVQTGFPAAVLNFLDVLGAAHTQSLLEWDVHSEVAPTSTFLLTGYSNPQLKGLLIRDHLVQANHLFATTSDVTSVTITDAEFQVPDWFSTTGAAQTMFDFPSKYSVQGTIYINSQSSSSWNAPSTFVGTFFTDDSTPFVFGSGAAFAQSLTSAKIAGPLTTTGSLRVGAGAVALASDQINPNIALGYANSGAGSYVDFLGANVSSGYSVRMMMQSAGQLTVTGVGGNGATIQVPGGVYSGMDFVGSGRLTIGQVVVSGTVTAGGSSVQFGGDAVNGSLGLGKPGSGVPYLDLWGGGVTGSSPSVRLLGDAPHQISVSGLGTTATLNVAGNLIASGSATVAGVVSAGTLVLTGAVAASQVFAGPSSGGAAPSFRTLAATDIAGVEKLANKSVANGYASLDGTTRIPVSQLPAAVLGGLIFQGNWDASVNTPTLTSGSGSKGFYYTVSVPGGTGLDGIAQWGVGDHAAFNGIQWEKFAGAALNVVSVAGRTGTVILAASDIGGLATVAATGRFADLISTPALPGVTSGGIVRSDGSSFGTVTIGAGLVFGSGTLSASGLVAANAPVFTASTRRTAGMGLVASGTTQATAMALSNDLNEVSTVSTGSNSVLLPDPGVGAELVVRNAQGSTALLVFPPVGQSIDIGSVNNPFSMGANSTKVFRKLSTTKWYSQ